VSQYEDILEIELLSSPVVEPSTVDIDPPTSVHEIEKPRPVTPLTLGGSKFRRKPATTESSSPVASQLPPKEDISETKASVLRSFSELSSADVPSTSIQVIESGSRQSFTARTSSGRQFTIRRIPEWKKIISKQNQRTAIQTQKDSYYGVDINRLLNGIESDSQLPSYADYDQIPRAPTSKELWTDKYRATKFVDLLGDERIHRDIMRWLKHWDYCVFGRDIPTSSSYQPRQPLQQKRQFGGGDMNNNLVVDPYQRPPQRLLMLHGPPGLGKTTLAHVAATLAGYEVLEINASDERTGAAARDRIVEAVETLGIDRSGRRGKERCVILDECDGGDANFVRVLLDLVHADEKAGGPTPKNAKGKKKKARKPLLRPIICICNDLYHLL
jgi:ATPase family associated with various cellular activities (AAA)